MSERNTLFHRIGKGFKVWLRRLETRILRNELALSCFKHFVRLLPIRKNKIVFDNFFGRGFGENPKYIAMELLRRNAKCKIIWLVSAPDAVFPEGVTPVLRNSLRACYESATAKVWVMNIRNAKFVKKRRGQIYLQTWHGSVALKKVEQDAEALLQKSYVSNAKADGMLADGIIVDGALNEQLFQKSFWLGPQCELLRFGSPRTDFLINGQHDQALIDRIRASLHIDKNAFFVLYAPTFRDDNSTSGYLLQIDRIRQALERRFGKTVLGARLHPNAAKLLDRLDWTFDEGFIDVTSYPDVQELVLAADLLITDYSSIAYDFAIIRKPVLLCVKDMDAFIRTRGVYDVFYEQPFVLNTDEEMLIREIESFSVEQAIAKIDAFYQKYPSYNKGLASVQTVDWLIHRGIKSRKCL